MSVITPPAAPSCLPLAAAYAAAAGFRQSAAAAAAMPELPLPFARQRCHAMLRQQRKVTGAEAVATEGLCHVTLPR